VAHHEACTVVVWFLPGHSMYDGQGKGDRLAVAPIQRGVNGGPLKLVPVPSGTVIHSKHSVLVLVSISCQTNSHLLRWSSLCTPGFLHRFEAILSGALATLLTSDKVSNALNCVFVVQPPIDAGLPGWIERPHQLNQSALVFTTITLICSLLTTIPYFTTCLSWSSFGNSSSPNAQVLF